MSYDLLTERELADEPMKEPPKRWVNWYRSANELPRSNTQCVHPIGSVFAGTDVWPSKDLAQSAAAECLSEQLDVAGYCDQYLGAFPEGERP